MSLDDHSGLSEEELIETGGTLAQAGRYAEALPYFHRAAGFGSAIGAFNLGQALAEQGCWEEAAAAYQQAEMVGDKDAALMLAFALRELGDREAALVAAERAAGAGDEMAAAVVACWRWCSSWDPALEADLRAGADLFPSARGDLGHLLVATGRIDEARHVLERGLMLNEVESMLPLGNLYADILHAPVAAEAAYRAGAALGDAHAHHNLARLLDEQGDTDRALAHFRLAAAGGDTLASPALRELEDEQRDPGT